MRYEKSCGVVVFRRDADGTDYVLMIRHRHGGHRSFPKGHMEAGETETVTAIREVLEETGVRVEIKSDFRQTVHYTPMPNVKKEVVYFLTRTEQTEIRPQEGEIAEVEWIPLNRAEQCLTHENDRTILRAAMRKLRSEESAG